MYPAKKSNALTEAEARKINNAAVKRLLAAQCEPTSRVIDECYGVDEWSAHDDKSGMTIYYLVSHDQTRDENLEAENYDWDNYYFTV